MITACRLFGYSSVLSFLLTLIGIFTLILNGLGQEAVAFGFIGAILSIIQGIFWALNK